MRAVLLALGAVCAVLAFSSAPALAARGHFASGHFGEPCTSEPCAPGKLKEPAGVAVNEATGDVYVLDKGNNRVEVFDAAGSKLEGEFNGSGLLAGEGSSAPSGQFLAPNAIAVDNSCALHKPALTELTTPSCHESDPSGGDVYVADAGHSVIDKFSATGEYLGQITGTTEGAFGELDGVATDIAGRVWVYQQSGQIDEFANSASNEFLAPSRTAGAGGYGFAEPGFAVSAKDSFYAVHKFGKWVASLNGSGGVLSEKVGELEEVTGVAAELPSGDVYLSTAASVARFNAGGALLETLSAEHLTGASGVGVNATSETVYVTDASAGVVDVFAATSPSTPTVEAESVTGVTAESATLEAEINPRGASTEYQFEYGPCPSGGCETASYPDALPIPSATLGASFEAQAVSVHPRNLLANTLYHYRVRVHNGLSGGGATYGEETKTFTTQGVQTAFSLPDGRAWELVSPPDKHGALIETIGEGQVTQAAADGSGMTYVAAAPTEDEAGHEPQGFTNKVQVLSTRGANGWQSRDIALPDSSATGLSEALGEEYRFFSEDLSSAVVQPFGSFIPASSPLALAPGEASEQTAFLHDLGTGAFTPLVSGCRGQGKACPALLAEHADVREGTVFGQVGSRGGACPPEIFCGPLFRGATGDLGHVVLESTVALTKTPVLGDGLYEWSAGKLALVSELPGGGAAPEPRLGYLDKIVTGAISSDGSPRVVFSEHGGAEHLYLRDMTLEKTVQLDEVKGGTGENQSQPVFQFATPDGSEVFFTDTQRLTPRAGGGPDGSQKEEDLYECKIEVVAKAPVCNLSDLTPLNAKEESADVLDQLLGASQDGSYLYFVANGKLTETANPLGEKPVQGTCAGLSSKAGAMCNLYVDHYEDGAWQTKLVAVLSAEDFPDWNGNASENILANMTSRVSPTGQWLAFMSDRPLAGNDTRDAKTGQPDEQVYLYDAATERIACPSCDPTGGRPVGVEYQSLRYGLDGLQVWQPGSRRLAASVPAWVAYGTAGESLRQPRYLDNSGRMFFNSSDALVPQDNNHTGDVYEFEPIGVPEHSRYACTEVSATYSERSGGCVNLISSGESSEESGFLDASENGEDVFFLTASKLVPEDQDTSLDVYDAHECTEKSPCFVPPGAQPPPCNTADACKAAPAPQPSIFGAPASATLTSTGNPPPAVVAKPKAKSLTRAQKLAKALKACAKQPKRKRAKCRAKAKRAYGPIRKAKKAHKGAK